jgi:hypothetical protein
MVPYEGISDPAVVFQVEKGLRPQRPMHPDLGDELWGLIESCWSREVQKRYTVSEILLRLQSISTRTSPTVEVPEAGQERGITNTAATRQE